MYRADWRLLLPHLLLLLCVGAFLLTEGALGWRVPGGLSATWLPSLFWNAANVVFGLLLLRRYRLPTRLWILFLLGISIWQMGLLFNVWAFLQMYDRHTGI